MTNQTTSKPERVTAVVDSFGGRYIISYRAREVWEDGRLLRPEADGITYAVGHPDAPEIVQLLDRCELHERAFGHSIPGGGTITRDGTVYDNKGEIVSRTTKPVGWSRSPQAEMPAVKISGELYTITELLKYAYEQGGASISPGRIPGYPEQEEN